MRYRRLKGYGLTYLGWLAALVVAAVPSAALAYLSFRETPSSEGLSTYADLLVGVAAALSILIIFEVALVVSARFFVNRALRDYPDFRKATVVWLCALLACFPATLLIGEELWLSVSWIVLSPLAARLLATRNR